MKRYYNLAIALQIICVLYTLIHNYFFMSQNLMFIAGILSLVVSLFLIWQSLWNPAIQGKQKYVGLAIASIPFLCIITMCVFVVIFTSGKFC
jgi:hypothetical protein